MALTTGISALAEVDLVISQGSDNEYIFAYATGDPAVPIDLTGWSARAMIRQSVSAETFWFSAMTPSTIQLTSDGRITVTIPHAITEADVWDDRDSGVWDLELTSPTNKRVRLVEGKVIISHDVTR